jgi:uncharacterized protein YbaP (TraB family)
MIESLRWAIRGLPAALVLAAAVAHGADRVYMWEARGHGGVAYLFGSVHLCRADCFPLPAPVVRAADGASVLALELDPEQPGVQESLLARAMYPPGQDMQQDLSPQSLAALKAALAKAGIPAELVMKMRPWMAGMTLTLLGAMQMGYEAEHGIDLWLLRRARERGKPVIELETVDEQIASLEALPREQQADLLLQAVALAQEGSLGRYVDALVGAWRTGDPERVYELSRQGLDSEAAAERLLAGLVDRRNRVMASRIADAVARHGKVFVVVGALHLAGRDSILERLRAAGFEVRQVPADR